MDHGTQLKQNHRPSEDAERTVGAGRCTKQAGFTVRMRAMQSTNPEQLPLQDLMPASKIKGLLNKIH